jgi:hypothetical protein
METVTAKELKELDPKRFDAEYHKWLEHAADYEWWDYIYDDFKEDMLAKVGMQVEDINFDVSYSQGDYAAFAGRMPLNMWMEREKWDEETTYAQRWPVLHLAAETGSIWVVTYIKRSYQACGVEVNNWGYPAGVFSELDNDTWEPLVLDQFAESDIEREVETWVNQTAYKLYKDLRDEYSHVTSEEMFMDSSDWNGVTFEIEEECV